MRVSLNQAIEIHAKALKNRFGPRAPSSARQKAHHCSLSGDHEGNVVWRRVAIEAEALLRTGHATGEKSSRSTS